MSVNTLFKGSCVALITPFKDGGIDFDGLASLIEFHISEGTAAILVLGTTGEPATMSDTEKQSIIRFAAQKIAKRVPFIVGAGGNNTEKVIRDSIFAEKEGADGLLLITPYYNKATQNGLVAHFKAVLDSVNIPAILYNVPGRTGVNMLPSTFRKIAGYKNLGGIKEASGNIEQICEMVDICLENDMPFYSGDDAITFPTLALGGCGVISVAANVIPRFMSRLCSDFFSGDLASARKMHSKLFPLVKALFIEVNPIPVKAAAGLMGLCSPALRMPLTDIEPENRQKLAAELISFGIEIKE